MFMIRWVLKVIVALGIIVLAGFAVLIGRQPPDDDVGDPQSE